MAAPGPSERTNALLRQRSARMRQMPQQHIRDWVDFLEALGPLIAVVAVLIVGFFQAYLQRQQLKQDLYDKRFRVYRSLVDYWITFTESRGIVELDTLKTLYAELGHAQWLFGPDVIAFLEEFDTVTRRLRKEIEDRNGMLAQGIPEDLALKCDIETLTEHFDLMVGKQAEAVMTPYLQIYKERCWLVRFIARVNQWVDQDQPASLASRYNG